MKVLHSSEILYLPYMLPRYARGLRFRAHSLGEIMENQVGKNMEHEMERGSYGTNRNCGLGLGRYSTKDSSIYSCNHP